MKKRNIDSVSVVEESGTYEAAQWSPDVRVCLARILHQLKARGGSVAEGCALLHDAGYSVVERTARRWMSNLDAKGAIFAETKSPGRPHVLSEEQHALLVGFVVECNSTKKKVNRKNVQAFLKDKLDVTVSLSTISNILRDAGFSFKVAHKDASEGHLQWSELEDIAHTFLKQLKRGDQIDGEFYNLDVTYNSHGNDDLRTYSASSSPASRLKQTKAEYTNAYFTMFASDGSQVPSIMMTANPVFDWNRDKTKRNRGPRRRVESALELYGISRSRIIFVSDHASKFAKESAELVRQYFSKVRLERWPIFTDGGTAFRHNGESLVENAGFEHVVLPSCIHHYLSVNDNNAHGVAKARWRAMDVDHSDDVASPLALMMCLDQVEKAHIRHWFIRNYLLDQNNIQIQYISALLGRPSSDTRREHAAAHRRYLTKFRPTSTYNVAAIEKIWSDLDGAYWVLE